MLRTSQVVLSLLIAAAGASFWFLLGVALASSGLPVFLAAADFLIFLSLLGLGFIFLPVWTPSFLVFISLLFIVFPFGLSPEIIFIVIFLTVLTLIPSLRVRREASLRTAFYLIPVLRKGIPVFLTVVALGLSIFFYLQGFQPELRDILPPEIFTDNFRLLGNFLPSEILSPGEAAEPSVIFENVVYPALISGLEKNFEVYQKYLPAVFSLGVFIVARSMLAVFGWASIALGWFLVKLGLGLGVIIKEERSASQEYLALK